MPGFVPPQSYCYMDRSVHIACTEKAGAVLLTTDDDLVKIMKKNTRRTSIRAENPLHWLMEMNQHGE
jgi:uncharacterized protein with PIN domain